MRNVRIVILSSRMASSNSVIALAEWHRHDKRRRYYVLCSAIPEAVVYRSVVIDRKPLRRFIHQLHQPMRAVMTN